MERGLPLDGLEPAGRHRHATQALLASLGSWSSVLPTVALRLPDPDPVRWLLPVGDLSVENQQPWMLKILDADAAVRARSWPRHLRASVPLTLVDGVKPAAATPTADGRCRWVFDDGVGRVDPAGSGADHSRGGDRGDSVAVRLDVRGLAVLYAGAGSAAMLRRAGLLDGGDARTDATWDAASAGPAPALLDFF